MSRRYRYGDIEWFLSVAVYAVERSLDDRLPIANTSCWGIRSRQLAGGRLHPSRVRRAWPCRRRRATSRPGGEPLAVRRPPDQTHLPRTHHRAGRSSHPGEGPAWTPQRFGPERADPAHRSRDRGRFQHDALVEAASRVCDGHRETARVPSSGTHRRPRYASSAASGRPAWRTYRATGTIESSRSWTAAMASWLK
jgi:hypothetical protein